MRQFSSGLFMDKEFAMSCGISGVGHVQVELGCMMVLGRFFFIDVFIVRYHILDASHCIIKDLVLKFLCRHIREL